MEPHLERLLRHLYHSIDRLARDLARDRPDLALALWTRVTRSPSEVAQPEMALTCETAEGARVDR